MNAKFVDASGRWLYVTPNSGGRPADRATKVWKKEKSGPRPSVAASRRRANAEQPPTRQLAARGGEPSGPMLALGPRELTERLTAGPNEHIHWYKARNAIDGPWLGPVRVGLNYVLLTLLKHCPSLAVKRRLCRVLGMKLGRGATIASGARLDYFFPDLIEIGDYTIIGMDSLLLTHEYSQRRVRQGRVRIGANVVLGAGSVVLAGVTIGDNAVVSAMSLVNKSVPAGAFVGGAPIRIISPKEGP